MTKKGWENRKNKAAFVYYILMIAFALLMLSIICGLLSTNQILFWWQENVTGITP